LFWGLKGFQPPVLSKDFMNIFKNTILGFLLVSRFFCSAQTHSNIIQPSQFSKAGGMTVSDHIYLNISHCPDFNHLTCFTKFLYKVNQFNLSVIDSIDVDSILGLDNKCVIESLETINDSIIVGLYQKNLGITHTSGLVYSETVIAFFDLNLQLLQHYTLPSTIDSSSLTVQSIKQKDSTFIIAGHLSPVFSNRYNGFIAEMNFSGAVSNERHIDWTAMPQNSRATISDIVIDTNFIVGVVNYGPQTQIIRFTKSLDLVSIEGLTNYPIDSCYFETGFQIFKPNNSNQTYLYTIAGFFRNSFLTPPGQLPFDMKLALVSLNENYLHRKLDTFSFTGYHISHYLGSIFYLLRNSISGVTGDSIFFNATDMFHFDSFDWGSKFPNKTFIYNVNGNQNMQVNWQRVYQPGYSHHAAGLRVLSGNRYLLIFTEYMWDTVPSENLRVRLMLLDETGAFLGDDNFASPSNPPQFYPNPASSTIRFNNTVAGEGSYQFEILDFNGRAVKKGHLDVQDALDVSDLPAATYQLILIDKTGWGWSTKLMISR
jgi:hypothetical protein